MRASLRTQVCTVFCYRSLGGHIVDGEVLEIFILSGRFSGSEWCEIRYFTCTWFELNEGTSFALVLCGSHSIHRPYFIQVLLLAQRMFFGAKP